MGDEKRPLSPFYLQNKISRNLLVLGQKMFFFVQSLFGCGMDAHAVSGQTTCSGIVPAYLLLMPLLLLVTKTKGCKIVVETLAQ